MFLWISGCILIDKNWLKIIILFVLFSVVIFIKIFMVMVFLEIEREMFLLVKFLVFFFNNVIVVIVVCLNFMEVLCSIENVIL